MLIKLRLIRLFQYSKTTRRDTFISHSPEMLRVAATTFKLSGVSLSAQVLIQRPDKNVDRVPFKIIHSYVVGTQALALLISEHVRHISIGLRPLRGMRLGIPHGHKSDGRERKQTLRQGSGMGKQVDL